MSTSDLTIWVIAADSRAALAECRRLTSPGIAGALVVSVVAVADMAGAQVHASDQVLIVGDWSPRQGADVQFLVTTFNQARATDRAPLLTYWPGEAPQVTWKEPSDGPMTVATPRQVADEMRKALDAARRDVAKVIAEREMVQVSLEIAEATVRNLQVEVHDLRDWLSGVLPVEDPEIPGVLWCAVCGRRIPRHAHGCPVDG